MAWRTFYDAYLDRLWRYLLVVAAGNEDTARESLQGASSGFRRAGVDLGTRRPTRGVQSSGRSSGLAEWTTGENAVHRRRLADPPAQTLLTMTCASSPRARLAPASLLQIPHRVGV